MPNVIYTIGSFSAFFILDFLRFTPFCVQQNAISGYYDSMVDTLKKILNDSGVRKAVAISNVDNLTVC